MPLFYSCHALFNFDSNIAAASGSGNDLESMMMPPYLSSLPNNTSASLSDIDSKENEATHCSIAVCLVADQRRRPWRGVNISF
jgi:F420-0:gamma-glutamyl ligase